MTQSSTLREQYAPCARHGDKPVVNGRHLVTERRLTSGLREGTAQLFRHRFWPEQQRGKDRKGRNGLCNPRVIFGNQARVSSRIATFEPEFTAESRYTGAEKMIRFNGVALLFGVAIMAIVSQLDLAARGQNQDSPGADQAAEQANIRANVSLAAGPLGIPLVEQRRQQAASFLSSQLHELIDLQLKAKQLHWNVTGPRFRPLHTQFDEIYGLAEQGTDVVAERMLSLGVSPNGDAQAIAEQSKLDDVPEGLIHEGKAVALGVKLLEAASERIHQRIDELGEVDAVSQDVLIEVAHEIDKQLWMLQAQQY
jgi:starvation-inducible DNA-binding protein